MERVTLVFEPAEEGGYSAYVAEVPGVNSQGETLEEAKRLVLEAPESTGEEEKHCLDSGTLLEVS
jgi:predicted RNase H-like HicB family nuclease